MQFWDHLEELRKRFFRIIIVVISLMIIVFSFKSFLFDTILFGPLNKDFITYQFICHFFPQSNICNYNYYIDLQNLTISGQFIKHISISFLISLFLAFPYIIWELWLFVKPGLYDYEKKSAIKILINSILLFIIGSIFYLIAPLMGLKMRKVRILDPLSKYHDEMHHHYLPKTKDRAKLRSKTYPGIAAAMAMQWGGNACR